MEVILSFFSYGLEWRTPFWNFKDDEALVASSLRWGLIVYETWSVGHLMHDSSVLGLGLGFGVKRI